MSLAYKISVRNRERKLRLFLVKMKPSCDSKILDVGYTNKEYSDTDNYFEKHYPYPEKITALGVEDPKEFKTKYKKIKVVRYNGGVFPFKTNEFDICWSNATIEHVGSREKQLFF